jgi:hypothetical protein
MGMRRDSLKRQRDTIMEEEEEDQSDEDKSKTKSN